MDAVPAAGRRQLTFVPGRRAGVDGVRDGREEVPVQVGDAVPLAQSLRAHDSTTVNLNRLWA